MLKSGHDFVKKLLLKKFEGMYLKKYQYKSYGSCALHIA